MNSAGGTGLFRRGRYALATPMGLLGLVLACADPVSGPTLEPFAGVDVRPFVVTALLADVNANGQFVFPDPSFVQVPESIGKAETRILAAAYVRTFGQRNLPFISLWERVRDATIDIDAPVPGSRVFTAESPVLLPAADSLASVRGQFGPFLVVHMFDGGSEPTVRICNEITD